MILKEIRVATGETRKVSKDWSAECEERGATISSSAWSSPSIVVTSPALSGNVASGLITPTCDGEIQNSVVLSNGETLVAARLVFIEY